MAGIVADVIGEPLEPLAPTLEPPLTLVSLPWLLV